MAILERMYLDISRLIEGGIFMPKYIRNIQFSVDHLSLISEFIEEKRLRGLSDFTLSANKYTLDKFFEHYQGNLQDKRELEKAVQEFLLGKGNAYYNKQLSILSQFFVRCIAEDILKDNPCANLKYRSTAQRVIDYDEQTIKKLLSLPKQRTFSGLRDYVFMITMLDNGIRPYEAIQLRISDIQEHTIRVRAEVSKTRTERYLPISKQCMQAIRKLISVRHESWDKQGVVFCGCTGEKLHRKSMQMRFMYYSKKLGINVTVYHLRHTFALWYIRNGGDAFALQKIMGHSTMEMTRTYVNIAMTDVRKNHVACSPLRNFLTKERERLTRL